MIKYKLSSKFVIFENCTMQKKKTATLIVMHDTTFSDHTTVNMWKFMHFVWHWKLIVCQIWCDFDRASSLICGNKMPTRCNRGFYCRSYWLLNMFRAPLCPSSGAQEYYTVVAACGILCCRILQTGRITLSSTPDQLLEKPQQKIPHAATTV